MPVISIVTAVYNGGHHFLHEAYESIQAQSLPPGWDWQWVVQEDGTTGIPLAELPADDRVSPGRGRAGRAAMARTVALSRVEGVLVRALDADDLLTPGALSRDIETLTEHPDCGWVVSGCLDLMPDGRLVPGPYDPPSGPLPAGALADGHNIGRLAVMGTTMCCHTELAHLVGGWQALPASEDVAILLAIEAVSNGWMIAQPSELYRRHDSQSTTAAEYHNPVEHQARQDIVMTRVNALRRTNWRWTPAMDSLATRRHPVSPINTPSGNGAQ